ncbi:MAG: hypothetical protein EOP51_07445 [Sphingobacteriales bacterium]|nr:MAG: hypothetical protein EOP51_07445 [Sphingobacteriales bacterium]
MKPFPSFLFLLSLLFCFSSGLFAQKEKMMIIEEGQWKPDSLKSLGEIKVLDDGFKLKCSYLQTLEQALKRTAKAGGNVLSIEEIQKPDAMSTCYRLWGSAYRISDFPQYNKDRIRHCYEIKQTLLNDTASYALVYFIRPVTSQSALVNIKVSVGDTLLKIHNGSRHVVKISNPGQYTIKVKNGFGSKELNLERGVAYFFKLEYFKGAGAVMEQVLPDIGTYYFNKIRSEIINRKG